MDEEMEKRLSALGATEEDLKDPEKVKEFAEKIEAENKALAEKEAPIDDKDAKVLADQTGRLMKALGKNVPQSAPAEAPVEKETLSELDIDNRVFVQTQKLDDDQVSIMNEYAQLPKNKGKSFESIFASAAVTAEFAELKAKTDAANELDTNANEERNLETNNELYEKHVKTGETPDNEQEHRAVAEKSLAAGGFREF